MNQKFVALFALLATSLVFAGAITLAGCKQGEGERCQIDDDCSEGLVCNQATQLCAQTGSTTGIDALAPADASVQDAPVDAPPDAPPDAPLDAR